MGTLSKTVFGFPKGKAGDIVFRVRYDKAYFCLKPDKYTRENTTEYLRIKDNFAFAAGLSSTLNKIKIFHRTWEKTHKTTSVYNKIMKENYQRIKSSGSISDILLIPSEPKFNLSLLNIEFSNEKAEFQFDPLTVNCSSESRIAVQGILHLSSPESINDKQNCFIPLISSDYQITEGILQVLVPIYQGVVGTEFQHTLRM
jgi:hypothetical protein